MENNSGGLKNCCCIWQKISVFKKLNRCSIKSKLSILYGFKKDGKATSIMIIEAFTQDSRDNKLMAKQLTSQQITNATKPLKTRDREVNRCKAR